MRCSPDRVSDLMFINFETAPLGDVVFPIGVGLCWFSDDGELRSASKIIRPEDFWDVQCHIAKADPGQSFPWSRVEDGEAAPMVADWIVSASRDRWLVSGIPHLEHGLLRTLYASSTHKDLTPLLYDFIRVVRQRYSGPVYREYLASVFTKSKPLDALDGALYFGKAILQAEAWQYSLDKGTFVSEFYRDPREAV